MKTFKQFISEEGGAGVGAPTNATGTAVVGTGDDSSTVVIKPKKKKRKPTPIGRYRTRVAWKESFSAKDSKKLQKAAVLSTSDDPKDQDRARARRTEIDFKDLQRQIRARKKLKEGSSIIQGRNKQGSYRGPTGDHKRDKDGNIVASHYKKTKTVPIQKVTHKKIGKSKKPKSKLPCKPKTPEERKKILSKWDKVGVKRPADMNKTEKGKLTNKLVNRYKDRRVEEESLDKPVQSMITQIKSRAKKY